MRSSAVLAHVSICIGFLGGCTTSGFPSPPAVSHVPATAKSDAPTPVQKRGAEHIRDDRFEGRPLDTDPGLGFGQPSGSDKDAQRLVRVFYATNRNRIPHISGKGETFGAGRSKRLTWGLVEVSIPPDHRLGAIERPAVWSLIAEDEHKHVVVKTIYETDRSYFFELLSNHANNSGGIVLFYVHGFGNSFDDAARRAAQMKYDLNFNGPTAFFSWPSNGSATPNNYAPDAANMEWSTTDIASTLAAIVGSLDTREVIVIAHSMGTKAVTQAVARADVSDTRIRSKVRDLILAAPDIDRDLFVRDLLPRLQARTRGITIYASRGDLALNMSRYIHATTRLGSSQPPLSGIPGTHLIDASEVDISFSGHSYYAENRSVISDLFYLIHEQLPPGKRATLVQISGHSGSVWQFKK